MNWDENTDIAVEMRICMLFSREIQTISITRYLYCSTSGGVYCCGLHKPVVNGIPCNKKLTYLSNENKLPMGGATKRGRGEFSKSQRWFGLKRTDL